MVDRSVKTFNIYFVDGKLYGYEINWTPYPYSARGYDKTYLLVGKSATFCIVSNDRIVNRSIALDFATAIAFQQFTVINLDLKGISAPRKVER